MYVSFWYEKEYVALVDPGAYKDRYARPEVSLGRLWPTGCVSSGCKDVRAGCRA